MDANDTRPHSGSLRLGRYSCPGQIYLITTVTMDRQPLLASFYSGRLVVEALRSYEDSARTLCFVVMPDHLHWLMELGCTKSLSATVAGIKRYSARRINRLMGRQGALWQSGFHDHALRKEEDIQHLARYIVANPLRAGLVSRIGDYSLWDAIWLE